VDPLPIFLTRDQMDVLNDVVILDPDPPWREKVLAIRGRHVALTDALEDSLPYLEGWL
jgi:hypothetical protein